LRRSRSLLSLPNRRRLHHRRPSRLPPIRQWQLHRRRSLLRPSRQPLRRRPPAVVSAPA
ncbi:unnamed protein product, partial [Scytosiphon promiscuus]